MSEYEDEDEDTDDSDVGAVNDSFAFLTKVKSNTPRARFDIYFYVDFIQLIQYNVRKKVSNRYHINKEDVSEMLRLPYSNGKHIFFVLHLKHPIVGGNKSTTRYDFVVFNFVDDEYEEISLDLTDPAVNDMFSEDIDDEGCISGKTYEVFETLLTKIFAKDVTTPAKNYVGSNMAPGLQCTFWDSDDHFLYPLDDGFVNVWKYCQKLKFRDVKNVRLVRSQGRSKTFDFYIYPEMLRSIRRYNIGSSKSQYIDCFFLEFKAIDQKQYDGLLKYCNKNQITIIKEDFRESASASSDSDGDNESVSQTETGSGSGSGSSGSDDGDDNYEVPDPHLVRCQSEGRGNESETSNEESELSEASQEQEPDHSPNDQHSTSSSPETSNNELLSSSRALRKRKWKNPISDADRNDSHDTVSPRKRSLRIESDDESLHDENNFNGKSSLKIKDADKEGDDRSSHDSLAASETNESHDTVSRRKRSLRIESDDDESLHGDADGDDCSGIVQDTPPRISPRKRSLRIDESDDEIQHNNGHKFVTKRTTINDSDESD